MSARPDLNKLSSKTISSSSMRPASARPASKYHVQSSSPHSLSALPEYDDEDLPRSTMKSEMRSKPPSTYAPSSKMTSEYRPASSYKDTPSSRVSSSHGAPKACSQAPGHGKIIHCAGCNCSERTSAKSMRPEAKSVMPSRMDDSKSKMASRLDFAPISMAPPSIKSVLRTPDDMKMASRQSVYSMLPPEEQEEQDDWAQKMIDKHGNCPEDKTWERRENPGGYQCDAGGHGMTDELLAEGKGGMLAIESKVWGEFKGPYYKNPVTGKHERLKS